MLQILGYLAPSLDLWPANLQSFPSLIALTPPVVHDSGPGNLHEVVLQRVRFPR